MTAFPPPPVLTSDVCVYKTRLEILVERLVCVVCSCLQDEFPVREDLSEISDDDTSLAKPPQPVKSTVHSFKVKNDADLFGLGLEETAPKESSEEGKGHTLFPLLLILFVRHLFFPKWSQGVSKPVCTK